LQATNAGTRVDHDQFWLSDEWGCDDQEVEQDEVDVAVLALALDPLPAPDFFAAADTICCGC
jgi:hypothetical protein